MRPPIRSIVCVAVVVTLGFALGCSEFVVIGIQPQIADAFGVSLAQAGSLISLYSVAYAVATPILAIATGRFRRYSLLVAYSLIFCTGNVLMAFAPTFEILLASRLALGTVSGALLALGITYIPELLGTKRTSMGVSLVYASFSVAMVIATSAGKLVAELASWHATMAGAVVFSIAVCMLALAVLPKTGAADEPATFRESGALLCEPQILSGISIFLFGVGSVYVFYGYVTPYLEDVLHLDALLVSGILMAYGALTFVSNLLSGALDNHFGLKATRITFLIQAVVLAGIFLLGENPAAIALVLMLGLTMYLPCVPCVTLYLTSAAKLHPKAITLASSLEPMAFNLGIAFGTAVGGGVVTGPGLPFVGLVGAVFSLLACGLAALTVKLARRRLSASGIEA